MITKPASGSDVDDVPRWSLWVVALVCFGPMTLTWLLGVLILPFWVGLLVTQLAEPDRFTSELSGPQWAVVLPIGLVIGGFIGLVGLFRVLTLSHRARPKSHRVFTIGMVAVGLVTLLVLHQPFVDGGVPDFSEVASVAGLAYFVLPFTGAAWLLWKSWKFLFAAR